MIVNQQAVYKILEEIKPATLVAATKYIDEKEIEELEKCGCFYYGENVNLILLNSPPEAVRANFSLITPVPLYGTAHIRQTPDL